jgi:hypothetical protein
MDQFLAKIWGNLLSYTYFCKNVATFIPAFKISSQPVLRIRIRDPVPFWPWIRDGQKVNIRIRDEHPGSYYRELGSNFWVKILIFFYADVNPDTESKNLFHPGSGMEKIRVRDKHP